jgi:hypothetical protein
MSVSKCWQRGGWNPPEIIVNITQQTVNPALPNQFYIKYVLAKLIISLLHVQSVPINTNVVNSNPAQTRCTRYNIMWWSLSMTCGRSVVFSEHSGFLHQYNSSLRYNNFQSEVKHYNLLLLTSSGYCQS